MREKAVGFDWFIDTVPEVIERVEQAEKRGEARGEVKGRIEGELQALRQVVLDIVQDRFPDLLDFVQSQVSLIKQPMLLRKLIRDLQQIPDETGVIRAFKMVKQGG